MLLLWLPLRVARRGRPLPVEYRVRGVCRPPRKPSVVSEESFRQAVDAGVGRCSGYADILSFFLGAEQSLFYAYATRLIDESTYDMCKEIIDDAVSKM